MSLSQMLLPEFDHEMANTRKALERVPEDKLEWQPHPKSMTFQRLAGHLATIPNWGKIVLEAEEFDLAPPGAPDYIPPKCATRKELLDVFDAGIAGLRSLIAAMPDEAFAKTWTLKKGGAKLFTLPRIAVLRDVIFNHNVHHRGQLTVYLRLNDVPIPALYGPSADEGGI